MTQDEMIEVLKQLVNALEANRPINYCENGKGERFPMFENNPFRQETNEQAIQAGLKAIADLESKKPTEWMVEYNACKCPDNEARCFSDRVFRMMQKYATPPAAQRTWVGLTRTELISCGVLPFGLSYELYKAIEAKLKEKNGYAEEKNT